MSKNTDTFESFQDLYSSDLIDLYIDMKDKLNTYAIDLLDKESKTAMVDFVKLIFDNVLFEEVELFEEEDEPTDLHYYP